MMSNQKYIHNESYIYTSLYTSDKYYKYPVPQFIMCIIKYKIKNICREEMTTYEITYDKQQ